MNKYLRLYKGDLYGQINTLLRNNNIPTSFQTGGNLILKAIKHIDRSMIVNKKEGIILYRGIPKSTLELLMNENNSFIEKGFSSTTPNIEIARTYTIDGESILKFNLPIGIKYFEFNTCNEHEFLLERNLSYNEIHTDPYIKNVYRVTVGKYENKNVNNSNGIDMEILRKKIYARMIEEDIELLDF